MADNGTPFYVQQQQNGRLVYAVAGLATLTNGANYVCSTPR